MKKRFYNSKRIVLVLLLFSLSFSISGCYSEYYYDYCSSCEENIESGESVYCDVCGETVCESCTESAFSYDRESYVRVCEKCIEKSKNIGYSYCSICEEIIIDDNEAVYCDVCGEIFCETCAENTFTYESDLRICEMCVEY